MRASLVAVALAISALPAAASSSPGTPPVGGWAPAGTMSTTRPSDLLGALLTDGRVLVTGTSGGDYGALGNVDFFDPSRGWSPGPALDGDQLGAVVAPLPNGAALLAGGTPFHGGFDGPGPNPTATTLTYDPTTNAWMTAPNMSTPRSGATATALSDGRVLVAGGYDRTITQLPNPGGEPFCCMQIDLIPRASAEIFDPRARRWSPAGTLAIPRFGHAAVMLRAGQVLVVGGNIQGNPSKPVASAELFDPATGRWSTAGTIGDPRTGFTLTALADGRALVAGGLASDGTIVLRSTLLYDPAKNAWSAGPDLMDARTEHAASALKDGRVLVAGGLDKVGRLAACELLDPAATAWTAAGALRTARSNEAALTLGNGRVLVAGGLGSAGPLQDSETFDPSVAGSRPPARTVAGPGRWLSAPAQPAQTYQQTLRLLRDGRVLALPEAGYSDFMAQVYDPTTRTWTTAITRHSDQSFISAAALADDRVLVLTLASDGNSPGKAEIVDLATGASSPAASPGALGSARLDMLPDGRVWLTGGIAGDKHTLFFDPTTGQWSKGPDVPADLYVGTVNGLPGQRILVGGYLQAMTLDLSSGAWTHVATYPSRWSNYSATSLPGGDVLLAGGAEDATQPGGSVIQVATTRVMRFNDATGALQPAAGLPAPGAFQSTAVLRDGLVLFAGGTGGEYPADPVPGAELYDPVKNRWTPATSLPEARSQASAVVLSDGTMLEAGGYGLFNPPPTLVYVPEKSTGATPVASVSGQGQEFALVAGLAILAASGLVSWVVIASARRRRSARGRL